MRKLALFLLAASLLCATACRKDDLDLQNPDDIRCSTYTQLFDALWHGMDQCYLFWDRDTTDWDAAYLRYRPLFEEWDLNGGVYDSKFSEVLNDWMGGLRDHHLSVSVRNPKTGNVSFVQPGYREVSSRDYYHYTWTEQQVACLKAVDGISQYKEWTGDGVNSYFCLIPIRGNDKIAYFRFSGFNFASLQQMVNGSSANYKALEPVKAFYGGVLDGMSSSAWANNDTYVKALILDVRGNGGGSLSEIEHLVGSLMQSDLHWGYGRVKEGLGRLDYSAFTPFHILCPSKHLNKEKPIVILADCNSVSCAEIMTQAIKLLPNGTFIGERTWGGTGPLLPGNNQLLYSGVFGNLYRCGYYVYTSNIDLVDPNYKSLEGIGIEPDIWVDYSNEELSYGTDRQLNTAIDYLKEKTSK